jgi:hypothetical protein
MRGRDRDGRDRDGRDRDGRDRDGREESRRGDLKSRPSYLMAYEILSLFKRICLNRFRCDGLFPLPQERREIREAREGWRETWHSQR